MYGAADFFGGLASRASAPLAIAFWSQAAGLVVLVLALPFIPGTPHAADFVWGGLCGVAGGGAVGLLYRALAIGTMGIVSPLTAVLAALLPVAFGLTRGEVPSVLAWTGIAVGLVAVVAIAGGPAAAGTRAGRGLAEAAGAGVLFGIFFIVLAQTRSDAGLYPLAGARLASLAVFGVVAAGFRVSLRPAGGAWPALLTAGAFDMLANILYVLASHAGMLAVVVVLTALYPASTVALAAVFLRERLRPAQWSGVALALVAVACLAGAK